MNNTFLIQVSNPKVMKLLQELEELNLLKVLRENPVRPETKLSEKYKDVFSLNDAKSFNEHTQTLRKEWDNT